MKYVVLCCSILLSGGRDSTEELRELAAGIILSDPDKYSSAILGQSNVEYVQWLQRKESWGGKAKRGERTHSTVSYRCNRVDSVQSALSSGTGCSGYSNPEDRQVW